MTVRPLTVCEKELGSDEMFRTELEALSQRTFDVPASVVIGPQPNWNETEPADALPAARVESAAAATAMIALNIKYPLLNDNKNVLNGDT